ncbi:receptor-type tyrosine-protein phosphatase mu-like [Haliotis asinina]|uniref:receptor-type tyrosine-protein phosphatase mu-like n=1 Tax=Haliotis asinina TaxID=109174 RepID=UPI003531E0D1
MEVVRLVVLLSFSLMDIASARCQTKKYGNNCAYTCNCHYTKCLPAVGCLAQTCNRGWSGRTCQKHNVALSKPASASSVHSNYQPGNAVNGRKRGYIHSSTCIHTQFRNATIRAAWWRVDLRQTTSMHYVTIYFRRVYTVRRNGIQIYRANTTHSPTDGVNCYNVTGNRDGTDIPDILKARCSGRGRYVVLYTTTVNNEINNVAVPVLDFCEVEINVCAPGTFGADCDNYCHCDGNVCDYVTGVCPSGVCLPGWQPKTCETVCIYGSYGTNCNHNCSDRKCKGDNSSCDRFTGKCTGGCQAGWNGIDCTQKCVSTYGENCGRLCSARNCTGMSSSNCDHVTGKCDGGCKLGWKGDDCTTVCVRGLEYGAGCVGNCSARMCEGGSGICPTDTGRCDSGCEPGWQGDDCSQVCSLGSFGVNCTGECGQCRDNSNCHHTNGTCLTGCSNGWSHHTCTQKLVEAPTSSIGVIAGSVGSSFLVAAIIVTVVVLLRSRRHPHSTKTDADKSQEHTEDKLHMVANPVYDSAMDMDEKHNTEYASAIDVDESHEPAYASAIDMDENKDTVCTRAVGVDENQDTVCASAVDVDENQDTVWVSAEDVEEMNEAVNKEVKEQGDDTYYNIASVPAVTLVSVDQLHGRIQELQVPAGGFQAEYQKLPTTFTRSYNDSQLDVNKGKNRFNNYYPYDNTRVKLEKLPDKPGSDYINASFIDGYSQRRAYIAAQGPTEQTLTDFWRLIWEKNCTRIVMLTNLMEMGKVKCVTYWSGESDLTVGNFNIVVTNSSQRAHWVIRELQVTDTKTSTCRCFRQFHFTTWPDHGTPEETSLTEFLWLVRKGPHTKEDPLLVHCSAGIGRTGTYIAVDYLLDQAVAEDKVDVFSCVSKMRDQRKGMIQTKEQYKCVYMTLQEALKFGNTTMDMQEFLQHRSGNRTFKMGRIEPTRFIQILNAKRESPRKETKVKGDVYVNGLSHILGVRSQSHLSMKGYLLTEAPSVNTASLFWKLMDQHESSIVIVLPDSHQGLSSYVPSPGDSLNLTPVSVRCSTENIIHPDIVLRNMHIQIDDRPPLPVCVYIMNQFPEDSHSTLLELLEHVDLHTTGVDSQPVAVIYSDSDRNRGAMLCILSNIVQGLKYDETVEIYNNMKALVHCLDQDITQADVALCYDVASAFIESQSIYANV